MFQNNH